MCDVCVCVCRCVSERVSECVCVCVCVCEWMDHRSTPKLVVKVPGYPPCYLIKVMSA